jgi:hypothetical protein
VQQLASLTCALYEAAPALREPMVSTLVAHCFPQTHGGAGGVAGVGVGAGARAGAGTGAGVGVGAGVGGGRGGARASAQAALPPLACAHAHMSRREGYAYAEQGRRGRGEGGGRGGRSGSGGWSGAGAISKAGLAADRLSRRAEARRHGRIRQGAFWRACTAVDVLCRMCIPQTQGQTQGQAQALVQGWGQGSSSSSSNSGGGGGGGAGEDAVGAAVGEAVLGLLLGRIYQQLSETETIFPSPVIMLR